MRRSTFYLARLARGDRSLPLLAVRPHASPQTFKSVFNTLSASRSFATSVPKLSGSYTVTYVSPEGARKTVKAVDGDNLLELAHKNNIDLEGACECSLACSTCHVIVDPEYYDKLEEPTDEENDMLDLAFGLTDTSRLGCQVIMNKDLDGITVTLPSATRNMRVDGSKPTPH
ncbi:2Fe-2S ferredoxin-type domain-containing protein [Polychytrium aggregatum]|uniref:2Fe-2S ferredoxin-type domain-containing protein n=1 Tax=Polychytrium aggregatum TaxID=110093 RepID=UPI0022FDC7C0|nr:2Fe-2S ferredoxin-type domain-containing protein [Polychytrium aggregatum]KAI9203261.1 2Fe-2S ferredoxin-type domain-containing protein [Polychytrium aggregatum]